MTALSIKNQWFSNIRADVLSGIVVALALIPESIAFSFIVGVDPMVGLYASFCIAIVIAFTGGRPGMISAATGAMALVLVTLVGDHGIEYMFAATILTGIIQIFIGWAKFAKYMKFVPKPVLVGFLNSLAIMIFTAQIRHFQGESWPMYAMVAASVLIIYLFPYITKVIPSSLVAIIVITIISVLANSGVRTVGEIGDLPSTLPTFLLPNVPLNFETLKIIFPYAISLSIVGLIESLLTATVVDDMSETTSDKNREAKGQGIANIVSGFFGGMAGCGMIGQSIINMKSGGRTRLSTFVAGAFLMVLIIVLRDIVFIIPMAALVGVMFMVCVSTFDWSTFKLVKSAPKTDVVVMIMTVLTVVWSNNLTLGVVVGILLSTIFFMIKMSKIEVEIDRINEKWVYTIKGQLFFASADELISQIDFNQTEGHIELDFSDAHIWDASAVAAIDSIITKLTDNGLYVTVGGINQSSRKIVRKLAIHPLLVDQ